LRSGILFPLRNNLKFGLYLLNLVGFGEFYYTKPNFIMWKTTILLFIILLFVERVLIGKPANSCFDLAFTSFSSSFVMRGSVPTMHEYINTDTISPVLPPSLVNCPESPGEGYHIVQPHETLYGISRAYEIPVKSLIAWNKIKFPDVIEVCQKIWLRKPPADAGTLAYKGATQPATYSTPSEKAVVRQEVYWQNKSVYQPPVSAVAQPQIYNPNLNTPTQPQQYNYNQPQSTIQPTGSNFMPELYNYPTTGQPQYTSPASHNAQPALSQPYSAVTVTSPSQQLAYFQYVVMEGESINSVAFKFNVNAQELAIVNSKEPDGMLVAGQRLLILRGGPTGTKPYAAPAQPSECPDKSGPGFHIVQTGETLADIAKKYGVSDQEIKRINNIPNSGELKRCMRINLPVSMHRNFAGKKSIISIDDIKALPAHEGTAPSFSMRNPFEFTPYTVKDEESLVSFARKKNINPQVLANLNKISIDSKLLPKQSLLLPKDIAGQ